MLIDEEKDRIAFEKMLYVNFLSYLIGEEKAQKEFKSETGYDVRDLLNRSLIDSMIDKVVGRDQDIIYNFIVWGTEKYFFPPEEAINLETYRKAKEYVGAITQYQGGSNSD